MVDNSYIERIFNSIGIMINEEKNTEIIHFFRLVFDKKTLKYNFATNYSIVTQPLGTFFIDFLNVDFENIEEFKEFFMKYSYSLLGKEYKKINASGPFSETDFNNIIEKLYTNKVHSLIRIQEQLDEILDYCILNPRNRRSQYSPLERFLVLQTVHENLTLTRNNKLEIITFYKIENQPLAKKNEDEIYKILENNEVNKYSFYIPSTIESIIYFVLCKILENKLHLKICKHCNNYFITQNSRISYCDRIVPNTEKTCKEIGSSSSFSNIVDEDKLLKRYYNLYSKKSMFARRNPDIQEYIKDFEKFKKYGKIKLSAYKQNKISAEEFEIWLNKKDK